MIGFVKGGHHLGVGVEGLLLDLRHLLDEIVPLKPCFGAAHQESHLQGVAHTFVALQGSVVAQCAGFQYLPQELVLQWGQGFFSPREQACLWRCFLPNLNIPGVQGDAGDCHPVFSESAGFIGADEICGPQSFHGREPVDQSVAPGHAPHPPGQGDGGHDGQTLRDGRHGKGDGCLDHQEGVFAGQNAQASHQGGDDQGGPDEFVAQLIQALLQGCAFLLRLGDERGYLAQLRLHAGGHDDGFCGSTGQGGALKEHVGPFGQRSIFPEGFDLFAHG